MEWKLHAIEPRSPPRPATRLGAAVARRALARGPLRRARIPTRFRPPHVVEQTQA